MRLRIDAIMLQRFLIGQKIKGSTGAGKKKKRKTLIYVSSNQ